jgi:Tol biopolymer transport system component
VRILEDFNTPSVSSLGSSLSCSPDGRVAAILWRGQPNVYTAELDPQEAKLKAVHRLTLGLFQDYPHAWTPDSRFVIFESERRGTYGIFKQAVDRQTAELIVDTPAQEVLPQVTPDGRWILYAASDGDAPAGIRKLMRVSIAGGQPEPVPIGGALDEFRCPLAGHEGCVLRETIGNREFVYYRLDALTGKGEELARRQWAPNVLGDWDVSPDGHSLAIPSHNSSDARVFVLPLKGSSREAKPLEIFFKDIGTLWSSIWAADGRGLYLSAKDGLGATLVFSTLDGHPRVLRRMIAPTLAVPSPDGKLLVFWEFTSNKNVWLEQQP